MKKWKIKQQKAKILILTFVNLILVFEKFHQNYTNNKENKCKKNANTANSQTSSISPECGLQEEKETRPIETSIITITVYWWAKVDSELRV